MKLPVEVYEDEAAFDAFVVEEVRELFPDAQIITTARIPDDDDYLIIVDSTVYITIAGYSDEHNFYKMSHYTGEEPFEGKMPVQFAIGDAELIDGKYVIKKTEKI